MATERPGLPERDPTGRFLPGEDPLVAVGVRIPNSLREKLKELAAAKKEPPTTLARALLTEAIEARWKASQKGRGRP